MANNRHTGKVKWFCPDKGYGFISFGQGDEAFVHFTAIIDSGFKILNPGEEVEFDLLDTIKGFQARNVSRLNKNNSDRDPESCGSAMNSDT